LLRCGPSEVGTRIIREKGTTAGRRTGPQVESLTAAVGFE